MKLLFTTFIQLAHAIFAYVFINEANLISLIFQENMLSEIIKSKTNERIFK